MSDDNYVVQDCVSEKMVKALAAIGVLCEDEKGRRFVKPIPPSKLEGIILFIRCYATYRDCMWLWGVVDEADLVAARLLQNKILQAAMNRAVSLEQERAAHTRMSPTAINLPFGSARTEVALA